MSSVALLPTHGDPFMIRHLLVNYDRVWRDEVDGLYVLVSGQPDQEVCDYVRSSVEAVGGAYVGDLAATLDHGVGMRTLAEHVGLPRNGIAADAILFVESDSRVRASGEIAARVRRVASRQAEVIGTPRVSMSTPLDEACRARWGQAYPTAPDGAQGYGLWPCFLFATAEALLGSTDHNFSARGWQEGEIVYGPDVPAGRDWCADTFGSAAMQLRARHLITPDVQYKGPFGWQAWFDEGHRMPWFHIGSLSSWGGAGGLTVDGDSELMDGRRLTEEMELLEWGHRVCWWERFLRTTPATDLPRHRDNYRRNVARMCEIMSVERRHVDYWRPILDALVVWDEVA